ncbi:hypothetical protein Ancab_022279 [Ancistrocladus abbreviatus]
MEENYGRFSSSRPPLKTLNYNKLNKNTINLNWRQKLRESCCRRVREDRARLLWKSRLPDDRTQTQKEFIKSALQDIVSDELGKIKNSLGDIEIPSYVPEKDDELWEYDGLHSAYQGECEDILLEMQRIFYEDLKEEQKPMKNISTGDADQNPSSPLRVCST